MENKCLKSITGIYKATNTRVLEVEAGVVPLDLHLDQIVLQSRDTPRCGKVIRLAKARIHRKLRGKSGKESQPSVTPMAAKDEWVRKEMKKLQKNRTKPTRDNKRLIQNNNHVLSGTLIKRWVKQKWEKR